MTISGIDKERMDLFWRVACSSSLEVHESAHALFAKAVGHELVRRLDSAGVVPQAYVNDVQVWVLKQLGSSLDPSMVLKIESTPPEG